MAREMNLVRLLHPEKKLVDVTGIEPVTPCLQSRAGKTLNALSGVAYTETDKIFALSNVPKLSRFSWGVKDRRHALRQAQPRTGPAFHQAPALCSEEHIGPNGPTHDQRPS